jgi:hypothetical protein
VTGQAVRNGLDVARHFVPHHQILGSRAIDVAGLQPLDVRHRRRRREPRSLDLLRRPDVSSDGESLRQRRRLRDDFHEEIWQPHATQRSYEPASRPSSGGHNLRWLSSFWNSPWSKTTTPGTAWAYEILASSL